MLAYVDVAWVRVFVMTKKRSAIFCNAIDSLRKGVKYFLDHHDETADKWAILAIFNAAELFLKEGLRRRDPALVYTKRVVTSEGHTVTVAEALKRYDEIGLEIDEADRGTLEELQRRRNRIEHHSFEPSNTHRMVAGETLRFIYRFLEDYLGTHMKRLLEAAEYRQARDLILEFEERLREAEAEVSTRVMMTDPKEHILHSTATCPECGNDTLMVDTSDRDYCYFCDDEQTVRMCDICGEYFAPEALEGIGICTSCISNRISRW
jgi:ribosomal protein S27AE